LICGPAQTPCCFSASPLESNTVPASGAALGGRGERKTRAPRKILSLLSRRGLARQTRKKNKRLNWVGSTPQDRGPPRGRGPADKRGRFKLSRGGGERGDSQFLAGFPGDPAPLAKRGIGGGWRERGTDLPGRITGPILEFTEHLTTGGYSSGWPAGGRGGGGTPQSPSFENDGGRALRTVGGREKKTLLHGGTISGKNRGTKKEKNHSWKVRSRGQKGAVPANTAGHSEKGRPGTQPLLFFGDPQPHSGPKKKKKTTQNRIRGGG